MSFSNQQAAFSGLNCPTSLPLPGEGLSEKAACPINGAPDLEADLLIELQTLFLRAHIGRHSPKSSRRRHSLNGPLGLFSQCGALSSPLPPQQFLKGQRGTRVPAVQLP